MTSLSTENHVYMQIHSRFFQEDFQTLYKLHNKISLNGYVYCEAMLGMYSLKQAAILAYTQIKERLGQEGYRPIQGTSGLWKHNTRPITFALCVDNFGVKYFSEEDIDHLLKSLQKYCKI